MKINNLYRKRLIPSECIPLTDDCIVSCTDEILVTTWKALRPKSTFSHGTSCYYLKRGIKVSRFLKEDGSLYCYYCDIVSYQYNEDSLTITDLLADVVIYPDHSVRVMDLDELADAAEQGLITSETLHNILRTLNNLLNIIYYGNFSELTLPIDPTL